MASLIPEDKITQISNRADIVEVISEFVRLKKTGRNFVGLCPFHAEKAPSFTVTPDKQMFYCFGCGVGGDVFKFVQLYEKLEFVDALRVLAERAGIELGRVQKRRPGQPSRPDLARINASLFTFRPVPDALRDRGWYEEGTIHETDGEFWLRVNEVPQTDKYVFFVLDRNALKNRGDLFRKPGNIDPNELEAVLPPLKRFDTQRPLTFR